MLSSSDLPQKIITRYAPTPSGYLHLGNIYNFLYVWKIARENNGLIHLRIDDCDATRTKDEYIEDIFEQLNWLGLDWDYGPKNIQDFKENYSQGLKTDEYKKYLSHDEHFFVCDCSRKQIAKNSNDGLYPGTCRNKELSFIEGKTCFRMKYDGELGDFIIWRKDNLPAYQLVSVIEDHQNNINLIIRGEDLKESSDAQIALARELQFSEFENIYFIHHPLLKSEDKKLSKSDDALSIKFMRENGSTPQEIYQGFANFFGLNKKIQKIQDLLERS